MGDKKIRRRDCVKLSNKIIDRCDLPIPRITSIDGIRSNLFVSLLQVLYHHLPEGIVEEPSGIEEEVANVQSLINHLALDLINIDLSHISGADVIAGDPRAIYNLLEIFCGLHKYLSSTSIGQWNLEESLTETESELGSRSSSDDSAANSPHQDTSQPPQQQESDDGAAANAVDAGPSASNANDERLAQEEDEGEPAVSRSRPTSAAARRSGTGSRTSTTGAGVLVTASAGSVGRVDASGSAVSRVASGGSGPGRTPSAGSAGRVASGESAGRVQSSGSAARVASGGSAARVASGGSVARVPSGVSAARVASGGSAARVASGGSVARVPSGVSAARVASVGSAARVASDGSVARVPSGVSAARVASGGSVARVPSGVSAARVASGGSAARVASGGSAARVPSGVSAARVASGGSAARVASGVSAARVASGVSAARVASGGSAARVASGGSAARLASDGSVPPRVPSSGSAAGRVASGSGSAARVTSAGSGRLRQRSSSSGLKMTSSGSGAMPASSATTGDPEAEPSALPSSESGPAVRASRSGGSGGAGAAGSSGSGAVRRGSSHVGFKAARSGSAQQLAESSEDATPSPLAAPAGPGGEFDALGRASASRPSQLAARASGGGVQVSGSIDHHHYHHYEDDGEASEMTDDPSAEHDELSADYEEGPSAEYDEEPSADDDEEPSAEYDEGSSADDDEGPSAEYDEAEESGPDDFQVQPTSDLTSQLETMQSLTPEEYEEAGATTSRCDSDEDAEAEDEDEDEDEAVVDISRQLSEELQTVRQSAGVVAPVGSHGASARGQHVGQPPRPGDSGPMERHGRREDDDDCRRRGRPAQYGTEPRRDPGVPAHRPARRRYSSGSSTSDPDSGHGRRYHPQSRNVETIAEIRETAGERAVTQTTREQAGDQLQKETVTREVRRNVSSAPHPGQMGYTKQVSRRSIHSDGITDCLESQADDTYLKVEDKEADVFEYLRREFPYVHVSGETKRRLLGQYRQQMKYIMSLVEPVESRKIKIRRRDVLQRQSLLTDIMRQQKVHDQRFRELSDCKRRQIKIRNLPRDSKISCLRAQRYVSSFQQQFESRSALNKSKEELLLRAVFEEMLEIQRSRLRAVRRLEKESIREFYDADGYTADLNRVHQYYQANFRDLAQLLARERSDLTQAERQQRRLADRIRREFKDYMEADVRSLNDKIVNSWQPQYRELDADRVRNDLYRANWKFCVT